MAEIETVASEAAGDIAARLAGITVVRRRPRRCEGGAPWLT
jgi:hypothetical protein